MTEQHWCIADNCEHKSLKGALPMNTMLLKSYNGGYAAGRKEALQDIEFMKEVVQTAKAAYDCANDDPVCFKGSIDHLMSLMREWGDKPL